MECEMTQKMETIDRGLIDKFTEIGSLHGYRDFAIIELTKDASGQHTSTVKASSTDLIVTDELNHITCSSLFSQLAVSTAPFTWDNDGNVIYLNTSNTTNPCTIGKLEKF